MINMDKFIGNLTDNGVRIRLPLLMAFSLLWGGTFVFYLITSINNTNQQLTQNINSEFNSILEAYRIDIEQQQSIQELALFNLSQNEFVINALKSGTKQLAAEVIEPFYHHLNLNYSVSHLYFIREDRSVLYRAHAPHHSDDIVNRKTMLDAERLQSVVSGLEFGVFGTFTLRSVQPIYEDKKIIGYLEVGMEIGHVIESIEQQFEVRIIEVIEKQLVLHENLSSLPSLTGRFVDTQSHSNYYFVYADSHDFNLSEQQVDSILEDNAHPEKGNKEVYLANNLIDYSGLQVGHFVAAIDISQFNQQRSRNMAFIIVGTFLFLAGGVSLFYVVLNFVERQAKLSRDRISKQRDELSQIIEELNNTQKQLIEKEKFASLGNMVAGLGHELNTPIGICITAASTLEDKRHHLSEAYKQEKLSQTAFTQYMEDSRALLESTEKALFRASELIKTFKQVAVDHSLEEKRAINLQNFVEGILITLRPRLRRVQHQLHTDCDDVEVFIDAGAIFQVVTNLIMNSLNHAFDDEIGNMYLKIHLKAGNLLIDYGDDGKGLDKSLINQLFEPFFTTKRSAGGTGLGTHIVYNLVVQRLNGSIKVVNERGLYYHIILPIT